MKSSSILEMSKPLVTMLLIVPTLIFAQIPEGYYDSADGLTAGELKSALHHIVSDHVKYPYTSGSTDVWDILKDTDEDPDNPDNVILIYTGRSQAKTLNSGEAEPNGSNRWNREHIWSKSHGFPSETDTGYTDIHHLRPADESVNSSRSNLDFDFGGSSHVEATECNYDSDSWEPRDAVKGDVARMMFYMVVRYDPGYHTDNSLYDLELVDYAGVDIGDPPGEPLFGKLSTLLQWHQQDPVDAFESNRNEVIYSYQGNRNPFIDHPEWADSIFAAQLAPNTRIGFIDNSMLVEEDIGQIVLSLSIINPDPTIATQCDVVLTGGIGTSADLDGFESASIYFPAGSSAFQFLEIMITDDILVEEQETFIFTITNVLGGDSAASNGNETFVLTINPNDQQSAIEGLIISEAMDGNRSGGNPKFLEITNTTLTDMDIGGFQIWRGSNGGEPAQVLEIPVGSNLLPGGSWVIAGSSSEMVSAGYDEPHQSMWGINGNGNDVYQLRTATGDLGNAFGLVGILTDWYKDSFAVRNADIHSGNASYDPDEWLITALGSEMPSAGSPGTPGTHIFDPWLAVDQHFHPRTPKLLSAYPNPFNAGTILKFWVVTQTRLQLDVFDIRGQYITTLLDQEMTRGVYEHAWKGQNSQGDDLPSGIYFVRVNSIGNTQVQRVSILR